MDQEKIDSLLVIRAALKGIIQQTEGLLGNGEGWPILKPTLQAIVAIDRMVRNG